MGSEREMRAAMFYLLYKSFFVFVFLVSSIVKLLLSQRGVFSEQVERQSELCVILSLSLSQRKTAALSTRKRCFFFFFFSHQAVFACDGQRSGFGSGCDVGCSLWARTQRGGGGEGLFLAEAPLPLLCE